MNQVPTVDATKTKINQQQRNNKPESSQTVTPPRNTQQPPLTSPLYSYLAFFRKFVSNLPGRSKMNCTIDLDCDPYITNRMCFGESGCQCNGFYGWVGDNCDDYGPGTYVSLVFWTAFTAIFLVLFVLVAYDLARRAFTSGRLKMTAANTSLIFLTLTFLGSFLRGLITVLNFATVEGVPPAALQSGHDLFGRFELSNRAAIVPLLGAFTLLAMMNVCLMWVDISLNSSKLRPQAVTNLSGTKHIMFVVQVTFVFVMIISLIVQSVTDFGAPTLMSLPFVILVTALYIKGSHQMHNLLTSSASGGTPSSSHAKVFLQSVRDCTRRSTINSIVFIVLQGAYALMPVFAKGDIRNLQKVLHHASALALSSFGVVLWLYLRRKPAKLQKKTSKAATSFNNTLEDTFDHTNVEFATVKDDVVRATL